jgi:hypothetical protein
MIMIFYVHLMFFKKIVLKIKINIRCEKMMNDVVIVNINLNNFHYYLR